MHASSLAPTWQPVVARVPICARTTKYHRYSDRTNTNYPRHRTHQYDPLRTAQLCTMPRGMLPMTETHHYHSSTQDHPAANRQKEPTHAHSQHVRRHSKANERPTIHPTTRQTYLNVTTQKWWLMYFRRKQSNYQLPT